MQSNKGSSSSVSVSVKSLLPAGLDLLLLVEGWDLFVLEWTRFCKDETGVEGAEGAVVDKADGMGAARDEGTGVGRGGKREAAGEFEDNKETSRRWWGWMRVWCGISVEQTKAIEGGNSKTIGERSFNWRPNINQFRLAGLLWTASRMSCEIFIFCFDEKHIWILFSSVPM